ncbi:uncharacterized protein METZ01_LOCUS204040, partial [marine metagenome]
HDADLAAIAEIAEECEARCAITNHFSEGGAGASELAETVAEATEEKTNFSVLYPDEMDIKEKIETVATKVYGAENVEFSAAATKQIDSYTANGFGDLPVCIAKTHLSVSSDASLKGAPTGWTLPVREVRASIGAGFVYPICGEMRTMPGLGKTPAAAGIDIDENGEIVGLS